MKIKKLNLSVLKEQDNTIEDLCLCFEITNKSLYRWIKVGIFPNSSIGIWTKATVLRWIEEAQPSVKEIKACAENFRGC